MVFQLMLSLQDLTWRPSLLAGSFRFLELDGSLEHRRPAKRRPDRASAAMRQAEYVALISVDPRRRIERVGKVPREQIVRVLGH